MVKEDKFDVAIIGAGPAGLMASFSASQQGRSVILIEKKSAPGKKLLLTGGGKCNLTNAEFNLKELVRHYNNGEFLFHIFSIFGPKETIEFFNELGLKTKIEKDKRVFPKSENASEVLEVLVKYLEKKKIKILFDSEVVNLNFKNKKINSINIKTQENILEIKADKYIISTGGKSYPLTGSDGFGYSLAEKLGHTIIKPKPALVSIKINEEWVKSLPGIALKDIKITVSQDNKNYFKKDGEILFTHSGISGPVILNASGKIGELLEKGEVNICLDIFPLLNVEELNSGIEELYKKYTAKTIKNILSILIPERFAEAFLTFIKIDKNKIANNISKIEKSEIIKNLKNIKITVKEISDFNLAMVTRGGISLNEIDHKTMKSKIIDNLYFAGEIIDIDGNTGGFNLQMCWSTGYIAGKNCF